jgi:hypothetical protein
MMHWQNLGPTPLWSKQGARLLLLAAIACVFCIAQRANNGPIIISTDRFQLVIEGKRIFLQSVSAVKTQRIAIPRAWLISPQEEKDEEEQTVSSTRFDHHVACFPIGNGEIGILLSSYDMMTEGSMQAGAGRDVFLIYDPAAGKLRPGHVDLGVTKERVFSEGCWHARMVHFIVSDVNQDGYADIGTIKEEIRCPEGQEMWEGDFYEQHPLHWYLFSKDGWKQEEDDSGWPDSYVEIPLIGIETSPVDFVAQVLWKGADPSSWKSPPRYVPTYRKKLIANELRRKSAPSLKPEKRK